MNHVGDVLLFRTGGTGFAVPLAAVVRLDPSDTGERLLDPVTGRDLRAAGESRESPPPEGVAVLGGEGLTLGVPMDTIVGIRSAAAVRMHPVPRLLSPCRWLEGLVEAGGDLYLLFGPRSAAGACGEVAGAAGRRAAPESSKAQEDTEK